MKNRIRAASPVVVILIFAGFAFSPSAFGLGDRKKFGIAYQLGGAVGSETIQNSALFVRKQLDWNLNAMLGVRFRRVSFGGYLDYRIHNQTSDPGSLGDTNSSGTSILYGPLVRIQFGSRIYLSAAYLMAGNYTLSATTSNLDKVTYSKPTGYRGQISLRLTGKLHLDFAYSRVTYAQSVVGATTYDLGADTIQATTMDFGFSLAF